MAGPFGRIECPDPAVDRLPTQADAPVGVVGKRPGPAGDWGIGPVDQHLHSELARWQPVRVWTVGAGAGHGTAALFQKTNPLALQDTFDERTDGFE